MKELPQQYCGASAALVINMFFRGYTGTEEWNQSTQRKGPTPPILEGGGGGGKEKQEQELSAGLRRATVHCFRPLLM